MDVLGFILIVGLIFLFWYFGFRNKSKQQKKKKIEDWDMESDVKALRDRMRIVHGKVTTAFKAMDLLAKITADKEKMERERERERRDYYDKEGLFS